MGEISVKLKIAADNSYTARISDDVPLSKVMKEIMSAIAKQRPNLNTGNASLMVGRFVRNNNQTLTDLGVKDGETLLILYTTPYKRA